MKGAGHMNIIGAIIAGILGTIAMVAFVLTSPTRMGIFKLDIAGYVGLMFTANPNLARLIGLTILTFNGAVLAIISAFLWDKNIGIATWQWGLIFGAVLGCLSLVVMLILGRIHPRQSDTEVASQQTIGVIVWLGHLVYGLITVVVYNTF
jgi:hypothetical protein